MIQEIAPYIFHNEYKLRTIREGDYLIVFEKNQILMKKVEQFISLPEYSKLDNLLPNKEILQFLFEIDNNGYYLVPSGKQRDDIKTALLAEGWEFQGNSTYRYCEPLDTIFAAAVSEHLARWYQDNQYCGCCGSKLIPHKVQRALQCEKCGKVIYPKISPCVIVAVCDGDRLLLTKYAAGASYRKYSLVAGFCEIGESVEETVHREVLEETGLKVKNLRYYKSQPWGFTDTMLFGFFVDLDGSDQVVLQEEELAEGRWFDRNEIPETTSSLSLTNEMIEVFRSKMQP